MWLKNTVKPLVYGAKIPKLKCDSSRVAVVFPQSIEARYGVENEDEVGATPRAMFQIHLSEPQLHCLLRCTYTRDLAVSVPVDVSKLCDIHIWLSIPFVCTNDVATSRIDGLRSFAGSHLNIYHLKLNDMQHHAILIKATKLIIIKLMTSNLI